MNLGPLWLTRKLLSFATVNPPGHEQDCAHFLGKLLEGAGYETRYYEFTDKRSTLVRSLVVSAARTTLGG